MSSPEPVLGTGEKRKLTLLAAELADWYRQGGGRSFPWREPATPLYQLVCVEVLLQRTRAETVASFYHRFFTRFPGWQDLADAPVELLARAAVIERRLSGGLETRLFEHVVDVGLHRTVEDGRGDGDTARHLRAEADHRLVIILADRFVAVIGRNDVLDRRPKRLDVAVLVTRGHPLHFSVLKAENLGESEEIGPLLVYLASEFSDFVTGQTIFVDGGAASHA